MATSYTSLLGLALPVTGELSGTWGDTVNNYITNYLDSAIAGAQVISGSLTAVTLSKTTGSSLSQAGSGATGSSQYQIIRCTGNPASTLTITAPATDKTYFVINATSTSQSVKIVGAGPTTGTTIAAGINAVVAWNGSDFVTVASTAASSSAANLAGGVASQIPYQSAPGTTAFIANGTPGQALLSNGSGAPSWGSPTVATKTWVSYTSTTTFTAPSAGTYRFYCFGAGGAALASYASSYVNSGAGGGCAFGDVTLTSGQVVTITISSGTVTLTSGATTLFTANKGGNATSSAGGTGGTASKDASVTNGGAYSGGDGGANLTNSGTSTGGSSGSPLGNGFTGSTASGSNSGGSGWGGKGSTGGYAAGGGIAAAAFGNGNSGGSYSGVSGRPTYAFYTDPLIAPANAPSGQTGENGGFGAGGGTNSVLSGAGGFGGGGAAADKGANGGFGGSAGSIPSISGSGVSGYGAGAGAAIWSGPNNAYVGTAGAAIVLVYY